MRCPRILLTSLLLASGCAYEVPDDGAQEDGSLGVAEQLIFEENALEVNSLEVNGLTDNGYASNGYASNGYASNSLPSRALTPVTISDTIRTALEEVGTTGNNSRSLLKYIVGCALADGQTFSYTWTDGQGPHNENLPGRLGLAPEWALGPLSVAKQKLVSSCVAARTNFWGVTVLISLRNANTGLTADTNERTSFNKREGAFWGNIFDSPPWLKSCYDPTNTTNSRSKNRACAAGALSGEDTLFCGLIQSAGQCGSVCVENADAPGGFTSCQGNNEAITTYLP